jgi:methylmalonyl-CoA/ethylmalonyl-CoA epimerase
LAATRRSAGDEPIELAEVERYLPTVNVRDIDHVAVAVERVRDVLPLYRDLLGGVFVDAGDDLVKNFRWVQFEYPGGFKIEILEPLSQDSFVRRFLDRRGPGMHHILMHVVDIDQAIEAAERAGYRVVDKSLRPHGWNEAFLHPKSTDGVLIEFGEVKRTGSEHEGEWKFPHTLEEVLDGVLGGPKT